MTTKQPSLAFDLGLLTVLRAVLQTITRMIYPFLAVFARGMGVEITAITTALGVSMLTALLGPLLAPLSDRYGRRAGILLGVSIFTLSAALVAAFPGFPVFALSLFLGNLAINIFLPGCFRLSQRPDLLRASRLGDGYLRDKLGSQFLPRRSPDGSHHPEFRLAKRLCRTCGDGNDRGGLL